MDGYRKVARVVVLGLMAVAVLVVPAAARAYEGMDPAERVQATGGGSAVGGSLVEPADIVRATAGGGSAPSAHLEPGGIALATGGGGTAYDRFLEPGEIAAATGGGGAVSRLEPADVARATGGGGRIVSAREEAAPASLSSERPGWIGLLVALFAGIGLGVAGTSFRHRRLAT